MSKRRVRIPVRPHIVKYLQGMQMLNVNGDVEVKRCVGIMKIDNGHSHHEYFSRKEGKIYIPVVMNYPSLRHQYALIRQWENDFKDIMHLTIAVQVRMGIDAMPALKGFLASYDISEEEYSIDAAYKSWQRFKKQSRHALLAA